MGMYAGKCVNLCHSVHSAPKREYSRMNRMEEYGLLGIDSSRSRQYVFFWDHVRR